ncbi:MAG: N,N-dimethylformamidase beta subunit family domain-containing protein [Nakamurella sp.]
MSRRWLRATRSRPIGWASTAALTPASRGRRRGQAGRRQAPAHTVPGGTNEPVASWTRSMTIPTKGWAPGDYLLRLDGGTPATRQFVPLTIRSTSFAGRIVLIVPDTTWQAYNDWGGHSLYIGPDKKFADRARAVPFDRPYSQNNGSSFFDSDTLPLVALAESMHLPLGYATDVDLQRLPPSVFFGARAVVSVGHDEYYSPGMRSALTVALAHGVNLAFLGSNEIYRKIRFASTPTGPDRLVINYKNKTDPIKIPSLVTTQWEQSPSNDPESSLTGLSYGCAQKRFPPLTVADASSWLFAGTGVHNGTVLPQVRGQEFDGIRTDFPVPRSMTILFHGHATCRGHTRGADSSFYTTPSGGSVFNVGAYFWVCALTNGCTVKMPPAASKIVTRMTMNYLRAAALGPIGLSRPANDTVGRYYPKLPKVTSGVHP